MEAYYLSTSLERNTSSESLSSNSSTPENSFTRWSEAEEEEEEEEEEKVRSYRVSTCSKGTVCMFISSLNDEIKDMRKIIHEVEEKLNNKDKEITEKNEAVATLKNQCKMLSEKLEQIRHTNDKRTQELAEKLNEKDRDIIKKNKLIAALENQCKVESEKHKEIWETNNGRIQKLEEQLNKKDKEITEKNEAVATLKNQCEINEQSVMKIQTQYDKEIKQIIGVLEEKSSEIKRLQKHEEIQPALETELVDLHKELDNYEASLDKANDNIKQLADELRITRKEKEELLHRLSTIAGAKLTYNNPYIVDLSDEKRPTKLAEEFAELYDNEWTDAFEDVDCERDEDKVAYMLSLFKTAYGSCKLASQYHIENMKSSICKLTLIAKQTSGERNKHPKTKGGEVVFDYENFQNEQKKAVVELGKIVENKLSTEFEKVVVDDIASEYCIDKNDRNKLYEYIQKCVNVCWSMGLYEIPVALGLQDVYGGMHLDTSVFKTYTKSGKFVDYIVWPPLYLHENGPLLCKGVAQGKA